MKKLVLLIVASCIGFSGYSQQEENTEIKNAINEQVWKPFKKSYESRDWKTFNALHTDDVLRVSKWGVYVGKEYKESVKKQNSVKRSTKKTIDFWLEHRIYSETIGYEVGYFRVIFETPGEETRTSHARFHVVLKKIDGQWKIAQDWDTSSINGVDITAEDFAKGIPLKL